MCEIATHTEHKHLTANANALNRRDPSGTTVLRRIFENNMVRRFNEIAKLIKTSIVSEDVFGLRDNTGVNGLVTLQDLRTPGRRNFNFPRDSRKISAFMDWLRRQVEAGVLDVRDVSQVGEAIESAWQNKYIFDSYKRGIARARQQMRSSGMDIPSLAETGGISVVLGLPVHLDRLGVLYTRAFNELRGITAAMEQILSRVLTAGLAEGQGPAIIARTLVHAMTGAGETLGLPISYVDPRTGRLVNYVMPARRRAQILARTEIIRAHAAGQLQEFKNWRVVGVSVKAEFQTAGDDRVCLRCSSMEGNIYTIEEAFSIIPVHAQCRCIWLPVDVTG